MKTNISREMQIGSKKNLKYSYMYVISGILFCNEWMLANTGSKINLTSW